MKYLSFLTLLILLPVLTHAATTTDTSFVPLTDIPVLFQAGNQFNLQNFLNGLYRICIGAAAVIAVLQIMRAGIMYMGGDSVTEKKEARSLIGLAIGGLILVLSPVIVFSIINPEILSLKIGGIDKLQTAEEAPTVKCTPACTGGDVCVSGQCLTPSGVGDGSCNMDCVAGKVCKAGSCVAPTGTGTCSTTVANNAEVKTVAEQNCCAAQAGCKVTLTTGSAFAPPICACTTPAAPTYGWRGTFTKEDGSNQSTQQRGPFSTQQQCTDSLSTWPKENDLYSTGDFTCNCQKPLGEQSSCSGF